MIIHTNEETVEKNNVGTEAVFGIKASAQAFKILANNLYSDKVRAIIRELSCNGWDSHREGDIKEPVEIQIPSYSSPNFVVRDFGAGITHEFMMSGYTQLFHTTKGDSNTSIGGFGLGRLSAFSYADSYTVVSKNSGIKRTYTVYMNAEGYPVISVMGEEKTNESGFEVIIPAKSVDHLRFRNEIIDFVRWTPNPGDFKVLEGAAIKDIEKPSFVYEGSFFSIAEMSQSYARIGIVNYPIPYGFNNSGFQCIIDFPIGDLEIAPSREALSVSESTAKKLQDAFINAEQEYNRWIRSETNKQENLIEAIRFARLHCANTSLEVKDMVYKGKTLLDYSNKWAKNGETGYVHKRRNSVKFETISANLLNVALNPCYIHDEPKYWKVRARSLIKNYDDKVILIPRDWDISMLGIEIPLLSSVEYTPPERTYSRRDRGDTYAVRVFNLGCWNITRLPLPEKALYIKCGARERGYINTTLLYRYSRLFDVRVFWIHSKTKAPSGWTEITENEISQALKDLAASKFPDGFPAFSSNDLVQAILALGSPDLDKIKQAVENAANFAILRAYTKDIQEVPKEIEEFADKYPLLRHLDSEFLSTITFSKENKQILKSYVGLNN